MSSRPEVLLVGRDDRRPKDGTATDVRAFDDLRTDDVLADGFATDDTDPVARHGRVGQLLAVAALVLVLVAGVVLATGLHQHRGTTTTAGAAASGTSAPADSTAGSARPTSAGSAALVNGALSSSSASASAAPTGPLKVVALGDSVAAGTNCSGCTNYVQLVANQLGQQQHRTPAVTNESGNGDTTADMITALQQADVKKAVAASDLVIVQIGANDLDETQAGEDRCASSPATTCYAQGLATARANLTTLLATINQLQVRPTARVVVMGYWNVFQDGQVAQANGGTYLSTSVSLTHSFNRMAREVALDANARWADAWTPFRGESGTRDDTADLASDGEHPSQAGHQLLANAVVGALGTAASTV